MELDGFVDASAALRCGVYALVSKGKVVYVGQSKCMLVRIYSHRNATRKKNNLPSWFPVKGIAFDSIFVRPCHPDHIDNLERDMINLYKPRYNTHHFDRLPVSTPVSVVVDGFQIDVVPHPGPTFPGITGTIERRI